MAIPVKASTAPVTADNPSGTLFFLIPNKELKNPPASTLPSSATIGDEVTLIDYAGTFDTNNLTVGRNSHNIQGSAADLTVSTERAGFTLVYVDSTQGWLLKDK